MTTITAHAELNEILTKQFLAIKEHYGIEGNADMIRTIIREKYREIQKVKRIEAEKLKDVPVSTDHPEAP